MEIKNSGTFCPYCGKQTISYSQQFDPTNGQPIVVGTCQSCNQSWQTAQQQPIPQQVIVQQTPKKKKWPIVVGVIVAIMVIGAIGNSGKNKPSTGSTTVTASNDPGSATPAAEAAKPEMSYEITDTSFNYYTDSIGSVEFYGIIEVTNTGNTNIYLKDCTFDLEDNDGHLLQSESLISSCPDIIAPGEKGYFYNGIGSMFLDKDVSTDNGLNLVPHYKLIEANGDIVDYKVTDTALRKDDFDNAKVTGRITNSTDKDVSLLYVEVLFKDASGKVLVITGTNVTGIDAGSTTSFEVSTLFKNTAISFEDIADYEVVARKSHYQYK